MYLGFIRFNDWLCQTNTSSSRRENRAINCCQIPSHQSKYRNLVYYYLSLYSTYLLYDHSIDLAFILILACMSSDRQT